MLKLQVLSYHIIPTTLQSVVVATSNAAGLPPLPSQKCNAGSNRIKRLTLDSERQAIATANWCTQTGLPQNCSVPTFPIRWQKLQTPNSNRLNVANHKNALESSTEKQTLTNCGMQKDISNGQRMPERSLGKTQNQLLRQPEPNQIWSGSALCSVPKIPGVRTVVWYNQSDTTYMFLSSHDTCRRMLYLKTTNRLNGSPNGHGQAIALRKADCLAKDLDGCCLVRVKLPHLQWALVRDRHCD